MQTVQYTAYQLLSCAKCNGDVIICVDDSLTADSMPFIEGTVASVSEGWSSCGAAQYTYGFTYDENDLADPLTPLVTSDINGVFCKGCLTTYIEAVGSPSLAYILALLAPFFDHICLVTDEAEFIAAIANVNCNHIVVGEAFTLTAMRTVPNDKALTILNGCPITTNGHTLTIEGPFNSGEYPCFVTASRDVLFAAACGVKQVVPQWFGATADGVTDDSAAIQYAIDSLRHTLVGTRYTPTAELYFPAGVYLIETGLDFTALTGITVSGAGMGSQILVSTSGTPGIDLVNSTRAYFRDLHLLSAEDTDAPDVMVLMARNNTASSAGWHRFENIQFEGPTAGTTLVAVVYCYAAEITEFYSCRLYARNAQAVGLYITSANDLAIASLYETISVGVQSSTAYLWMGGHIVDNSAFTGANSVIPVKIHNSRNVTLSPTWIAAGGNQHIYLDSDGPGVLVDTLNIINARFEPGNNTPLYCVNVDPGSTTVTFGSITGNIFACSDAIINCTEPGTHNVVFELGLIQGNNYGGGAPNFLIDMDGALLGGCIDAFRLPIQCYNAYGCVVSELNAETDFVCVSGNPGFNLNLLTSGLVNRQDISTNGIRIARTGADITRHLSNTGAWNPNIANGATGNTTVGCLNAAVGDTVAVGFNVAGGVPAGVVISGSVTAANTVTVSAYNLSGAPWAPGAGTLRVDVWQH